MVRSSEDNDPMSRLKKRRERTGRGPPPWAVGLMKRIWGRRFTPFSLARCMPRKRVLKIIKNGVIRDQITNEEHK